MKALDLPINQEIISADGKEEVFAETYLDYISRNPSNDDFVDNLIHSFGLEEYLRNRENNSSQAISDILAVSAAKRATRAEEERVALHDEKQKEQTRLERDASFIEQATLRENELNNKRLSVERLKALVPILAVVVSFVFITWIGNKLQEDSFNRKVVFEAQLARFQSAETEATEIGFDLRDVYYRILMDRKDDPFATRYKTNVRAIRKRLETLANTLRGFPEYSRPKLNEALLVCISNIDKYLSGGGDIDLSHVEKLKELISSALIDYLDGFGAANTKTSPTRP